MGILNLFYSATSTRVGTVTGKTEIATESTSLAIIASTPEAAKSLNLEDKEKHVPIAIAPVLTQDSAVEVKPNPASSPTKNARRFSIRALPFARKLHVDHKPALSTAQEHDKRALAIQASTKRVMKEKELSKADKRAKEGALNVRAIIIGPTTPASPKLSTDQAKPQLNKVKSQLTQAKSANRLILQLRQLPANDQVPDDKSHSQKGPIHAVCLEHPDAEEHQLHFEKLCQPNSSNSPAFAGVVTAPFDAITEAFRDMKLIDLVNSPDFGLGQPGDGEGILAGAVPTAETVINGIKQITPELMALGYATGRAITPDHSGIHPPTDRMSVLTYWWGFELLLPPPSLEYLSRAHSVSGALINFLSAVALVNNGVREILPFIRYIAQFVDFEFSAIKKQDLGDGVVCAATWIIPAALVPRPWDFPPSPHAQAKEEVPVESPSQPPTIISPIPEKPNTYSLSDTVTTDTA
ncbi:hypothetical protein D9619_001817 [Psilocybe cf. subviscida]|uniref:Uncharacterized protein n=1 Tax=Psilocybe cf. subviscida TaxID=2480587 RepID=A0A8H5BEN7_9AGAR|nr:hypothetical protein D9619_001817 [Psilocybe cf. subviscida]